MAVASQILSSIGSSLAFNLAPSRKGRIHISPPVAQKTLGGRNNLQEALWAPKSRLREIVGDRVNCVEGRRLIRVQQSHLPTDIRDVAFGQIGMERKEAPPQIAVDVLHLGEPSDKLNCSNDTRSCGYVSAVDPDCFRKQIGQGNNSTQSRNKDKEIKKPVQEGKVALPVLMVTDVPKKADFAGFSLAQRLRGLFGWFQSVGSRFRSSLIFSWRRLSSSSSRRRRSCSSRILSSSRSRSRSLSISSGGIVAFGVGHEGTLSIRDLQSVGSVGGCEARADRRSARATITRHFRKSAQRAEQSTARRRIFSVTQPVRA